MMRHSSHTLLSVYALSNTLDIDAQTSIFSVPCSDSCVKFHESY